MNRLITLVLTGLLLLAVNACKSKKQKPVTKPTVKKTVVHKDLTDSLRQDSIRKAKALELQKLEEQKAQVPDDKYFLIAGSFQDRDNAEKFKAELESQGYEAKIIVRETGPNQDFYKVSYKSFYDRNEAFKELSKEKQQPNNEHVWLLIK